MGTEGPLMVVCAWHDGAERDTGQWVVCWGRARCTGSWRAVVLASLVAYGFLDGYGLRLAVKTLPEPLTGFEPLGCPCSA